MKIFNLLNKLPKFSRFITTRNTPELSHSTGDVSLSSHVHFLNNRRATAVGNIQKPQSFEKNWNIFRNAYNILERNLQKEFQQGISLRRHGKHVESIQHFDSIINLFSGENLGELSGNQRSLLAQAHFNKADVIRVGKTSAQKEALVHLQCALDADPTLTEAKDLITGLELEDKIPYSDVYQAARHS